MRFVVGVGVIDFRGDPNNVMPWNEAVHGLDHKAAQNAAETEKEAGIAALRRTHKPSQAYAALLGLARIRHPAKTNGELRDLILKLGPDDLYRMLWLYQRDVNSAKRR